jgi:hypothetical protein
MLNDQNLLLDENPFAYAENPASIAVQSDLAFLGRFNCADILQATTRWMIASLLLLVASASIWTLVAALSVVQTSRVGEWNSDAAIAGGVGMLIFLSTMWPGYWILKTRRASHRAVKEPALWAIAEVLEAQRCFWRALGILVLLAIAAIVVAATYPTWGLSFG